MNIFKLKLIILACILVIPLSVSAHPGRTDSSGCHNCRKNCVKWGVPYGYHCHGGSSSVTRSSSTSRSTKVAKSSAKKTSKTESKTTSKYESLFLDPEDGFGMSDLNFGDGEGRYIFCATNHYDCEDFKDTKTAQAVYDHCKEKRSRFLPPDVHKLDKDDDGNACN